MNEYRHHVSGIFAQHVDAEYVLAQLVALGLPRERLYILSADSTPQTDDAGVLNYVLVDGAIATAVGTGIGALAELALIRDAISSGQVVLVAETRTAQETANARQAMRASVGASEDVSTV